MSRKEKVYGTPKLWVASEVMISLCPGCQHGVVARLLCEVMEELGIEGRVIGSFGAGCNAILYPGLDIDGAESGHGRAPDLATAIKRTHPDAIVFTLQGDGDLAAIGAGPLIGALTRGEKITIFMANNGNYGSTGGQLAPTTTVGQVTATTPDGRNPDREGFPFHAAELIAQFRGTAYSARGAVNTPANYRRTKAYMKTAFQKQLDNVGLSFLEILTACPTQWHLSPQASLKWIEEEMIPEFPLGEFKNVDKIE